MKDSIKGYINKFFSQAKLNIKDLKNKKTFSKQIPNILTFSRAVAPIPINILFFTGNIPAALIVCGATFLTDAFDGAIARKLDAQSQFGADLDAICDKLLIAGISIPIIVLNPLMIINVVLETLISITNVKAKLNNKNPKSSLIGKAKTWVLSLTVLSGYITSLFNIELNLLKSILMIIPTTLAQSITYIEYLKRNNKINKEEDKVINTQKNNSINNFDDNKKNVKDKVLVRPYTIEDYQKLKDDLLSINNEKEATKTKTKKLD